jgi:DNA-binding NarL/FixJ family response regulator
LTIRGQSNESCQIRVLIADASPLFRSGIRQNIEGQQGFEIIGEAETPEDAIALARETQPKVVIVGLSGHHGKTWEAIADLAECSCVLVITGANHPSEAGRYVLKAFLSGALGCVDRLADGEELNYVVRSVASGKLAVSSGVAKVLVDELFRLRGFDVTMAEYAASILRLPGEGSRMPGPESHEEPGRFAEKWDGRDKLTAREIEVLALVAEGESNRDIAARLMISEKTVKNHISSILRKLGMSRRTEAAVWAVTTGFFVEAGLNTYNRRPRKNES